MPPARAQLGDDLLRQLAASLRSGQPESRDLPGVAWNTDALIRTIEALHDASPSIEIGVAGDALIVDGLVNRSDAFVPLIRRLRHMGIERIAIDRGAAPHEIAALADMIDRPTTGSDGHVTFPSLPHIHLGSVTVTVHADGASDLAAFRRLYADAALTAEAVWQSTVTEQRPDATVARTIVERLAQAVSQNPTAVIALTALRDYDNYMFTHMVNVSILTMAQARALGIDGAPLREFGLAALMHDIGKVRTPLEILDKADALTPAEFEVMKRHTVDGAEILRATPDVPPVAAVVAFEHHRRLDGSGYPESTEAQPTLHLGSTLCAIADVYDAMRSHRAYQGSLPNARILAVLQRNDGRQFDQHLVRRFAQLIGIYPVGNAVRLTTGEVAIVTAVHASDPYRPQVKVVIDRHGARVTPPIEFDLREAAKEGALAPAILGPIDPADFGLDPFTLV